MAVIRVGDMVTFRPGAVTWLARVRSAAAGPHAVYMVLKVEGPDAFERMALILHPGGETSWQYPHNLEAVT